MDRMSGELRAAERIAAVFAPALPEETPIAMPEQSLWASPEAPARAVTTPSWMPARRLFVIGGTILFTAAGANEMYRALSVGGLTPLELIALTLYVALFAWIAFSFISAIAGFVSRIRRGGLDLGIAPGTPLPCCTKRT